MNKDNIILCAASGSVIARVPLTMNGSNHDERMLMIRKAVGEDLRWTFYRIEHGEFISETGYLNTFKEFEVREMKQ